MVRQLVSQNAYIDCTPNMTESVEAALQRCKAEIIAVDTDDAKWHAMHAAPFMRDNAHFDYQPLAKLVRAMVCPKCSTETPCGVLRRLNVTQAYFMPRRFGSCEHIDDEVRSDGAPTQQREPIAVNATTRTAATFQEPNFWETREHSA